MGDGSLALAVRWQPLKHTPITPAYLGRSIQSSLDASFALAAIGLRKPQFTLLVERVSSFLTHRLRGKSAVRRAPDRPASQYGISAVRAAALTSDLGQTRRQSPNTPAAHFRNAPKPDLTSNQHPTMIKCAGDPKQRSATLGGAMFSSPLAARAQRPGVAQGSSARAVTGRG